MEGSGQILVVCWLTFKIITSPCFIPWKTTWCLICEMIKCWEPAWGTPPMAKVMRKEAWHTQRRDQASGNPLFLSMYPQNQSTLRGLSPITISLGEGVNLQLQVNKNSWAWQECFNLWTLEVLWPAWSGSSGRMWLFTASQQWEARDVLKLSKYRLFWEVRSLV